MFLCGVAWTTSFEISSLSCQLNGVFVMSQPKTFHQKCQGQSNEQICRMQELLFTLHNLPSTLGLPVQ